MRTLILAAVLFCNTLLAQTTFAPMGATWSYDGWHYAMNGQLMIMQPHINNITSVEVDTVQGRICTVLFPNEMVDCNYSSAYITMEEDTVRYWNSQLGSFDVLYVMNTLPGGSWVSRSPFGGWYDVTWTVADTTTIIVGGLSLRQLDVDGAYGEGTITGKITERLGFDGFLFPWDLGMGGGCDMGGNWGLRCYQDPEISWLNPQFTQCDLNTSIPESATGATFLVHPTILEAGETAYVTVPTASMVEVTDATGRLVNSTKGTSVEVRFTMHEPGIYFVRAISGSQRGQVARILVH